MVVVVLTACPVGLRGDLTRWLLEIASGVFVGHVTARVRDRLWERITGQIRTGKAIMVYSARNEQHLGFKVHRSDWDSVDCEGLALMEKPADGGDGRFAGGGNRYRRTGWSNASKYRRAAKFRRSRSG
ncbi:type I-E CRISPR-associated endoribonuclease Cas2 [Bifidobacterium asteroides]|nr:type I-E CRISPR-associated endoribonuclease Cas2 [Bifidobacterium asteroides]